MGPPEPGVPATARRARFALPRRRIRPESVLLVSGAALVRWPYVLARTLPSTARVGHGNVAWVGLDAASKRSGCSPPPRCAGAELPLAAVCTAPALGRERRPTAVVTTDQLTTDPVTTAQPTDPVTTDQLTPGKRPTRQ
ncbi:hypothetical protein [Streptomyces sp. MK37H]|uniref:hypothetical protein n=1 Tax=Streptomyces sp. MK37H TaxID=2699117 RepID=UPI001B37A16F|nr:hypothetical protein [Streptomyces sp. MK37H]MBP8532957.1 hypothetical protein [Streptomyces sp. MK37H]